MNICWESVNTYEVLWELQFWKLVSSSKISEPERPSVTHKACCSLFRNYFATVGCRSPRQRNVACNFRSVYMSEREQQRSETRKTSMHESSFYVCGNKRALLLRTSQSHQNIWPLFYIWAVSLSFFILLCSSWGWWRLSKQWQWKSVESVWWFGAQPRGHCINCSTLTPKCLESPRKDKILLWDYK